MFWHSLRHAARLGLTATLAATALCAAAGAQATHTASDFPDSRIDLYGGYAYLHPINSGIDHKQYQDLWSPNATVSAAYYFNRYLGVQVEGGYFSGQGEHQSYSPHCSYSSCDQLIYTAEAGPIFRFPLGRWVPFVHALGGGERTNGPVDQSLYWGWGVTGGGGVDYILPLWGKHLAIRPIQADFQYSQVVYGPLVLPAGNLGGLGEIDAVKLSAGVTLRLGDHQDKTPLALGCVVEPSAVLPGEPITVTASTVGLDPKRKPEFSWTANGGQLTPNGAAATIDTTGMPPGEYVIGGHVQQGLKSRQQASCEAPFSILKAVQSTAAPSISCSANPVSAPSGTTIEINAEGTSPGNRPLTYSYQSTAGVISGTGSNAHLTTAGLSQTDITVTCNTVDDLGQQASAQTTVHIASPALPVIPQTQTLCSLSFARDHQRPARVDNEAKACLDDIALTMSSQTESHLVMVGNTSPDERPELAAERALNARQYLVQEKGIDNARIELRVGQTSGRTLDNVLIPSGATYLDNNTQLFNEHAIQRHGEAYGIHHGSAAPILPGSRGTATHRVRRHRTTRATAKPAAGTSAGTPASTSIPPLQ
ncbi:MAG: outer membrane beta-barrel protein [Acidobacteriaceae bacterium]|nr:outer membrane beta-barrel protein [Acidobacteriaceae bacterium]